MLPLFAEIDTFNVILLILLGSMVGGSTTYILDDRRQKRIEQKLDKLITHFGLDEPRYEWQNIYDSGPDKKYAAIKALMDEKGFEWADAQYVVEEYIARKKDEVKWG